MGNWELNLQLITHFDSEIPSGETVRKLIFKEIAPK